jgi:hypothetical protein
MFLQLTGLLSHLILQRFRVYYRNTLHDEKGYRALLYLDGQASGEAYYGERLLRTRMMARLLVSPTEARAFVFNHAALTGKRAPAGISLLSVPAHRR